MKIQFKKIISLLIILSLVSTMSAFASDYSGHWAENEIKELLDSGIISGDSRGIRPDDTISRAEFATVINRLFSYTESDGLSFPDVKESDWYYTNMCIAKTAGYIKGDAYGNANPNSPVTRAEACTMYARILKLENTYITEPFDDDEDIPDWAKGPIYALARTGLIMGYVDGTFKPTSPMNRAEVFVVSSRIQKSSNNNKNDENNTSLGVATVPQTNTGSGGGGGVSGGNSGSSGLLPAPIIKNIDTEKMQVTWDTVAGAVKYEIVLKRTTNSNEAIENTTFESNQISVDISSYVNSLMNNKKPTETYFVKVRAIASDASNNSSFSTEEKFTFENPSVKLPDLRISQTILNDGSETIKVEWDPAVNASGYQLSTDYGDGNGYTPLTVIGEGAVIDNDKLSLLSEQQIFKFKAISATPGILDSDEKEITLDIPLYAGKEGANWLIKNQRHFENIAKKKSERFLIAQNIVLNSSYQPIDNFSGILDSKDGYGITVNINYTAGDNAGLFAGIRNATIKNITLSGEVKGKLNVGAIAGIDYEGSLIENCKNKAKITSLNPDTSSSNKGGIGGILGTLSSTGKVLNSTNEGEILAATDYDIGGIVGLTSADGGIIQSCINKGKISGYQRVGGMVGYLKAGGSVLSSRNEGEISVASSNGAGIIGYSYGNITDCYNTGNVAGNGVLAGIAAVVAEKLDVTNCYNNGTIKSNDNNIAAGIIANVNAGTKTVNLSNCYNTGSIISTKGFPIYSNKADNTTLNVSDCYYLEAVFPEEKAGVESKTDSELKSIDLGTGYSFNIAGSNLGYLYPQIKSNPHKTGLRELPLAPFNLSYTKDVLTQEVTLTWDNKVDNDYDNLLLTIKLNDNFVDGYNQKEIAKNETSYVFKNTEQLGRYTVTLVSKNTTGESEEATLFFDINRAHSNLSLDNFLNTNSLSTLKDNIILFEYIDE